MEEIWKDIEGYEGKYQISNLGRLKTFDYKQTGNENILKGGKDRVYCRYYISIYGKGKKYRASRLVAKYFIPNPNNLPYVCHKDETLDENGLLYNGADNLFWGNNSDNMKDMFRKGRGNNTFQLNHPAKGKFGKDNPLSKPVNQYKKDGTFIKEWGSIIDIERDIGIWNQNISKCCKGKYKSAGGFIWRYI